MGVECPSQTCAVRWAAGRAAWQSAHLWGFQLLRQDLTASGNMVEVPAQQGFLTSSLEK